MALKAKNVLIVRCYFPTVSTKLYLLTPAEDWRFHGHWRNTRPESRC